MANLIIKSSADNLVLQGSDASPAITVGATGTTTFAENLTLSGTANNLGTVTAGTIASAVNLNHNAKKNAWSRYATAGLDISSAAVVDFGGSGFIGSNITESSGRMTCTVAGLYLIMLNMSQFSRGNRDIAFCP